MNQILKFLGLILLFFSHTGCQDKAASFRGELLTDIVSITWQEDQELKASSFAKKVKIIPLELKSLSAIRQIHKIVLAQDRVYLLDRLRSNGGKLVLKAFDWNGNFIFSLDPERDYGPELTSLTDITLNAQEELVVLDGQAPQLSFWQRNGQYLRSHPWPVTMTQISFHGGNYWGLRKQANVSKTDKLSYRYLQFDPSGNLIHGWQPLEAQALGTPIVEALPNQGLSPAPDGVWAPQWLADSLLYLHADGGETILRLDLGKKGPSLDLMQANVEQQYERLFIQQSEKVVFTLGSIIYQSEDRWCFSVLVSPDQAYWATGSLGGRSLKAYSSIVRDETGNQKLPFLRAQYQDWAVGLVDEEFFEYFYPEGLVDAAWEKTYEDIVKGANPCLVFYHLKQ